MWYLAESCSLEQKQISRITDVQWLCSIASLRAGVWLSTLIPRQFVPNAFDVALSSFTAIAISRCEALSAMMTSVPFGEGDVAALRCMSMLMMSVDCARFLIWRHMTARCSWSLSIRTGMP